VAQAFCSSSAASPSRILGTNQGLNVHLVEAAGIPPASAVAVVAQLTRLQAVQHCWMKHRSCLHGCAGCAALLDEACSRALIGRCAVPVAGRRAEGIEPSDAMTTTTWLSILVCFVCFLLLRDRCAVIERGRCNALFLCYVKLCYARTLLHVVLAALHHFIGSLRYGCCCCYWSSKVCPADVTPCPVQVRRPREMANHTDTRCGTRLNTRVKGQAYENRR